MKTCLAVSALGLAVLWFSVPSIVAQQPQPEPKQPSLSSPERAAVDDAQEARFRRLREEYTAALEDARKQAVAARAAQHAAEDQLDKLKQSANELQSTSLLSRQLVSKELTQAVDADAAREGFNLEQQRKKLVDVIINRHQQVLHERNQRKGLEKALAELAQSGLADEAKELAAQARELGLLPSESQKAELELLLLDKIKVLDNDLRQSDPKAREQAAHAAALVKQALVQLQGKTVASAEQASEVVPMVKALRDEVRALREEVTALRTALEQRRPGGRDQGSASSSGEAGNSYREAVTRYLELESAKARTAGPAGSARTAAPAVAVDPFGNVHPPASAASPAPARTTSQPKVPVPEPAPTPSADPPRR